MGCCYIERQGEGECYFNDLMRKYQHLFILELKILQNSCYFEQLNAAEYF